MSPARVRPRFTCLLSVLAASLLLLSALAAAAASAAPSIGLQWSAYPRYEREDEWDVLKRSGTAFLRLPLQPGGSLSTYDKAFIGASKRGIAILPQIGGAKLPTTAAAKEEMVVFVRQMVKRYGYNGKLWEEPANAGVPEVPAQAWEIWNEPNLFGPEPAATYAQFLAEIGPQIQNASEQQGERSTEVLMAAMSMVNEALPWQNYVNSMYAAVPGLNSAFTGIAYHPYVLKLQPPTECGGEGAEACSIKRTAIAVRAKTENAIQWFKEAHGAVKDNWITELGWTVGHNPPLNKAEEEIAVTEPQQAALLTASFNQLKGIAAAKNIKAITWYNDRDADNPYSAGWPERCGLRDEVGNFRAAWFAFQGQTGAASWPYAKTAFQANTETLWTYSRLTGGANSILGMSNSSPAVGQNKGAWTIAFRANTGNLFTADPAKFIDTKLAVAAGTNPAISALAGGAVAFQANTGNLWVYREGGEVGNTGYGMAAGTSPSITALDRGGNQPERYPIAFQGNTGTLWVHEPGGTLVGWNTTLKMAPGTSPSIAALDNDWGRKAFVVAYQAADGTLSLMEPEWGTVASTGLGMANGTSPAVTSLPGGKFAIAFQANTGTMWTYIPGGAITNSGYGMQPGTSPSITAIHDHPNGLFQVDFMANTGQLWTYEPFGFVTNTLYGSKLGTSPSVAPG